MLASIIDSVRKDPAATAEPPESVLKLQWLAFDLDNVLYDATGWWDWVVHQLIRFGVDTQCDALRRVWDHDWVRDAHYGRAELWTQFNRFLRALGLSRGQASEMMVAARPRHDRLLALSRPCPMLSRTLDELRRRRWRLALAAATTLSRSQVGELLGRWRVEGVFEHVWLSQDAGPDALQNGVAASLASRLGLATSELGFVGSSSCELSAARRSGAITIGLAAAPHIPVAWRIDHFACLARIPAWQSLRQAG